MCPFKTEAHSDADPSVLDVIDRLKKAAIAYNEFFINAIIYIYI